MRKSWKIGWGLAALLLALPLTAQQTSKEAEVEAGSPTEYEKLLNPPDKREILDRFVGTWTADHKALLYGKPFREGTLKETFEAKWILNDRFLQLDFAWELNGATPKGMVIMGYNGALKHFTRLYLIDGDSRGTPSTGVYIRSKDSLVFRGMEDDPVSGDSFEKRDVFTFGPDKTKIHYQQIYAFADGSELTTLEGTLTRVKDGVHAGPQPKQPAKK